MCVVSAVSDYYTQKRWMDDSPTRTQPGPFERDPEAAALLRQAIEILERIDKRLGDTECNDPAKAKLLKALDEYAKAFPQTPIPGPSYDAGTTGDLLRGLVGTNLGTPSPTAR